MRNLKKVIALVAVFAMMVSTVAFAQTFTDVAEDHNYYGAIEMLSSLQILTGDDQDGDGKLDFRPEDTITRAEVAAVISRIQNILSVAQTDTEFVDVPASHWASGYVAQAAGQGIVNGYGDGNFGPEDPVLYEQAVKMLIETLGYAPFVKDNGGYPTGHLTAASRYGVLEGVVGGAIGAQATRGMVAQMVYNAIDTPLMDRFTYGAEAEYVIYDGKNDRDYLTLLNRDLGVKKFTGIVASNAVTGLTSLGEGIDTDKDATVKVNYDYSDDYYNYDVNEIDTIFEADSNASDLLGYQVEMYVQEAGRDGYYDVLSVAATNKNKTAEFTLDQFAKVDGQYIEYYKNETDRNTTKLRAELYESATDGTNTWVADNFYVIYNGVYYGQGTSSDTDAGITALNDLIANKGTYGGKVTLVDNDSTSGYDVAFVEIASTGVVEDVSTRGKVNFKEAIYNSLTGRGAKIELVFDEDETDTIIELTKNGEAIEYTELTEWDVLSVLYSGAAEYYVAEVVESGKVEGSISGSTSSDTSAGGYKYTINGTAYDVAVNAYGAAQLEVGAAGVFYIDNYGKLVAYDKNGTTVSSDKYAYVLDVSAELPSDFGDTSNIRMLLLDKSGDVYEAQLASKVKLENFDATKFTANTIGVNDIAQLKNLKNQLGELGKQIKGQLITYDANSAGEVDEIVLPYKGNDDQIGDSTLWQNAAGTVAYDEEDFEITVNGTNFDVTEDMLIFYINMDNAPTGAAFGLPASKTASKIGTGASLATLKNKTGAVYNVDNNDVPDVIVLFNTTGGISPAGNAAVIDEIGDAYVDGDEVTSVTYFYQGEKLSAVTDVDFDDTNLAAAEQGDMWKLSVRDGVIYDAEECFDVAAKTRYATPKNDDPKADLTFVGPAGTRDTDWFFGPAVDYTSGRIKIAKWDDTNSKYILDSTVNVKSAGANVYVYDPAKKNNKLTVGDASDVYVEEEVLNAYELRDVTVEGTTSKVGGSIEFKESGYDKIADGNATPALGMLDYVAAIAYEGDVLDIVIYRAYEFDIAY